MQDRKIAQMRRVFFEELGRHEFSPIYTETRYCAKLIGYIAYFWISYNSLIFM